MNDESSRSHLIISICLEVFNKENNTKKLGKISLVDLAGSERQRKANLTINQQNEGRAINKALSALNDVISALANKDKDSDKFVPYRNSKLTYLMKDSIGGNAKTLMIINVSPADYNSEETNISLQYGSRVKLITNDVSKNIETREYAKLMTQYKQLCDENEQLKKMIQKADVVQFKNSVVSGYAPSPSPRKLLTTTPEKDLAGPRQSQDEQ